MKDCDYLMRLIESLTPGGSEFHESPERCAEFVRDRLSSVGRLAADRNRLRGVAVDALLELERLTGVLLPHYEGKIGAPRQEVIGALREALRD